MKWVTSVLLMTCLWFAQSWWVMVALGLAHGADDRVPALGFWPVLWLVSAIGAIVTLQLVNAEIREATR